MGLAKFELDDDADTDVCLESSWNSWETSVGALSSMSCSALGTSCLAPTWGYALKGTGSIHICV